jgi:hypothetical protein
VKWILDDMVFGDIAQVIHESTLSAWPSGELLLADATAQAASEDRSNRRRKLLQTKSVATGEPVFTPFEVTVLSQAGDILYNHLRPGRNDSEDLAEHQSIAWALTDPDQDSVLVTLDKVAAMLALAELGRGRVCHPYELWDDLRLRHYLDEPQFNDLLQATAKRSRGIPAIPWRIKSRP